MIRLGGDQTGGVLAIVEHLLPPGATGAMPHIHHGHAEHFHVLDGLITFRLATGSADASGRVLINVEGKGANMPPFLPR